MGTPTFMEGELFGAAVEGDVRVLSEENVAKHGDAYYKDQTTPRHNNIVHIAAEHARAEFIDVALARFPVLGSRKNDNGDTPLHVASRKGYDEIVKLLVSFGGCDAITMQNLQGDTPLHLALSNNKLRVAMNLLQAGSPVVLSLLNACQETPLHVFLKYCVGTPTTSGLLLEEGVMNLQGIHKSKRPMSTSMRSSSLSPSLLIQDALKELLNCKPATFMVDAEGLTPLLLAAQQGSLMALWLILKCSPQSAELCDNRGRTMLHCLNSGCLTIDLSPEDYASGDHEIGLGFSSTRYWELKKLLNIPEIDAIKDSKDYNGSTPAHVALGNGDFVLVKVLFECFADFTIKNKHGVSALDLIKTCPDFATKMEEVNLTEKVLGKQLDEMIIQKAKNGDLTLFEIDIERGELVYPHLHDHFMRRTSQGHSILHEAIRHGNQTFVEEAIKHFPTLVFTADSSGETPLHVGAKLKNHHPVVETLLQLTQECVNKFRAENGHLFLRALPWRQRNSKGDTPLHEALHSSNYEMAKKLVQIDSELCSFENNAGETPLHILARCSTYSKFDTIGAMVKLLMSQNENVVYKRDSHGFTPLLRASYCGRIRVAYWIIRNCPASVQFRDPKGRNFLHLLRLEPAAELEAMTVEDMLYVYSNILVLTSKAEVDGCQGPVLMPLHKYKDLRKLTGGEFDALRSSQDHDGNTPLHSALNDKNFGAAMFLLHWCVRSEVMQEMSIYNNKSQSVLNLLELLDDDASYVKELKDLASLAQKKIKEEAFGKQTMDKEVYKEAVNGNMDYFLKENEENQDTMKFLSQVAQDGSNILHIAIQHKKVEFAKEVMECYPDLMWERDYNGNTPLHTAAKLWDGYNLFDSNFEAQWEKACRNYHDSPTEEGLLIIPPWRVKNSQGNTPYHEAANSNSQYAVLGLRTLHTFDPEATTYVNRTGDTSLHIYAENAEWANPSFVIDVRDREGLTPFLRAAKCGNCNVVDEALESFPQLIQVQDDRGRSLLHHLRVIEERTQKSAKELYNKFPTMDGLRKTKDFDGNTPLHWTIQDGNPMAAKLIAERFVEADGERMASQQLWTKNNEGKSIMDLLASHDDTPTEVLQLLINKAAWGANVHGLYARGGWVRSGYGVCKSQIKDMANTLSVVAGLLATITFAAAFQVPGGFSGDSGSPVLVQRAAFKVFMIFNSFAMCGSMTVLFFLLWVMLTYSVTTSFLLLDMSIAILQLSFGATLLSFMTGVYVATSHKALWLAIFICGLCSTVIVLLRKNFILRITQFVKSALRRLAIYKLERRFAPGREAFMPILVKLQHLWHGYTNEYK